MPASKIALDFLDFCERQTSAQVIEDRFVSTLQALGYEYVACASHVDPLRPRPGGVSVLNYPVPWVQHYSEADFARIDPVFLAARIMSSPFNWVDCLAKMRLSREQQRVLDEGALYGLSKGLTIPLRSPDVIPASCSLIARIGWCRSFGDGAHSHDRNLRAWRHAPPAQSRCACRSCRAAAT